MRTHEDIIADGCANFDAMDLIASPHGGHLVVTAVSQGAHVCWGCGEPFQATGPEALVEVKTPGAEVPCALHVKCVGRKPRSGWIPRTAREVSKAAAAIRETSMAKRIIAGSHKLAEIASAAKGLVRL